MSHWQKYHARWSQIQPPLRPDEAVVQFMQATVSAEDKPVLLLGVTPELADAFQCVQAVDKNPAMIANVWPGDTATKRAREGDWLSIAKPEIPFFAVIGDGSLNNIAWPHEIGTLLNNLIELLAPGGIFACRLFERPAMPISELQLRSVAAEPAAQNFHAFKWQLAMHLAAAKGANVPVARILDAFNALFPDRAALSDCTGWPQSAIDTIDVYHGSHIVYSFPSREEFSQTLPAAAINIQFHQCGTYDLASCCPILTFQKPR